jgi:endonuclease/exonuclease/phosphatase family metal-dependent hydrolase
MSPRLPGRRVRILALLALGAAMAAYHLPSARAGRGAAKTYLFCFWNVENLFDDRPNPKLEKVDREFDRWFSDDKEALRQKLDKVVRVLLHKDLSAGRGPDVIALAEVESHRAADLVKDALNARLRDRSMHYSTVLFKDPEGGRSIACAIITRLNAKADRTRLLGRRQRILKAYLEAGGHELVVVASHWASQVSDTTGRRRDHYADTIYRDFKTAYAADPKVDYLVCGDFNANPDDPSVRDHLHATGDVKAVLKGGRTPLLFNPFAQLAKNGEGSHFFRGKPLVYDQVCLSPGLLDGAGWSYKDGSARIVKQFVYKGRPDRFGGPRDRRPWRNRGASDHFPVTVELRVGR